MIYLPFPPMGGRNRHITAVFLLVIVLAPLSYHFIFQARQQQIRHHMKEELEHARLQELVLPTASLQWAKPGKEILIGQELFDVKSIRYDQYGMAHIRGLFDKAETALVKEIQKDFDQQNRNGSRQIIHLFKTIQSLPESGQFVFRAPAPESIQMHVPQTGHLPHTYLHLLTPPPRC